MGNPHPTKSKPCKIGRKHTGAKSLRELGRIASAAVQSQREEYSKWKDYKKRVAEYWRGRLDSFPTKP